MVVLIENNMKNSKNGFLESAEVEAIERVIYKHGDDLAVSIARSFERMEERIDAAENRIYSRLSELENELGAELKTLRLLVEGDSEVVISDK